MAEAVSAPSGDYRYGYNGVSVWPTGPYVIGDPPGTGGGGYVYTYPEPNGTIVTVKPTVTVSGLPEPDDDVKANLRHLCDEAVNFLRSYLFDPKAALARDVMGDQRDRVELAFRILKELGCPPG